MKNLFILLLLSLSIKAAYQNEPALDLPIAQKAIKEKVTLATASLPSFPEGLSGLIAQYAAPINTKQFVEYFDDLGGINSDFGKNYLALLDGQIDGQSAKAENRLANLSNLMSKFNDLQRAKADHLLSIVNSNNLHFVDQLRERVRVLKQQLTEWSLSKELKYDFELKSPLSEDILNLSKKYVTTEEIKHIENIVRQQLQPLVNLIKQKEQNQLQVDEQKEKQLLEEFNKLRNEFLKLIEPVSKVYQEIYNKYKDQWETMWKHGFNSINIRTVPKIFEGPLKLNDLLSNQIINTNQNEWGYVDFFERTRPKPAGARRR